VQGTALRLGLMLSGGIMVVLSFILLAFGESLGKRLVSVLGRGSTVVDLLLSGPVWGFVLLLASLLLLYWFAPDLHKSFRWIVPGAVVAALAIAIVIALLDLVLTYTNPGSAYGAAGSVLILLWALFIFSQIVIVGGIVNAVLGRRHDRVLAAARREHPEKRLDLGPIAISVER
jgi:membrane protein